MKNPIMENSTAPRKHEGGHAHSIPGFRTIAVVGLSIAAAMLAGCSSSSSSKSRDRDRNGDPEFEHLAAQFAADRGELGSAIDNGDNLDLPMYQQAFNESGFVDEDANFRLRANGSQITIETSSGGDPITWSDVDTGQGVMAASRQSGDPLNEFADFESQYYDFVQFGYWSVVNIDIGGSESHRGGVFHQGFETRPENMPTDITATYSGDTLGVGFHNGEFYDFAGTVNLTANFGSAAGSGSVTGEIDTPFHAFDLSADISGNRFTGSTSVREAGRGISGGSGDVDGRFYGPAAEEAGGTWRHSDGGNFVSGGFGARQN